MKLLQHLPLSDSKADNAGLYHSRPALLLAKLQPAQQEQALASRFREERNGTGAKAKRILLEAGLACDGVKATPTTPLPTPCLTNQLTSTHLSIPAPGTENDGRNPSRVKPTSLFDASVGGR